MSTSLITRGVLAVILGIIALVWPGVTILALVLLFAVYAFMDAVFEGAAFGAAQGRLKPAGMSRGSRGCKSS